LEEAKNHLEKHQVNNPGIIIDASHDNCIINGKKDHTQQSNIILEVLQNLKKRPDLKSLVKGFMVESFLKSGSQKVEAGEIIDLSGLSITDPCLGWEETENLLFKVLQELENE
jgi:3-deoxy-7-phosphoheptulonate synthase